MTQSPNPPPTPSDRLVSLDAFRGAIMLLMASSGFGITQLASRFPDSSVWRFFGHEFDHAEWVGCTLWDLIQPAFMFMVGVALPWSIANRRARGQSFPLMLAHALWRSLALVLLAVFLTSAWSKQTDWIFPNVLAQIGLGYPVLFLVAFLPSRAHWIAAFLILAGVVALFALHPLPPPGFDWQSVGVPADWNHLSGFSAHWEKNFNVAASFDRWFLNLFPRATPFVFNAGGYTTLNFVPSIATMIFGLIAGNFLRGNRALGEKIIRLVVAGICGMILGKLIEVSGLCPIVKRLWSPSWAIYSTGLVTLLLAAFVAAIELRGWKRLAYPLVVAGVNPITLYCLWQLSSGFFRQTLKTHLGPHIFESFGILYTPVLERVSVLLIFWLILLWMHRRKIFLRI